MGNENTAIVVLSIFALIISIIALICVSSYQPEGVDLSGIGENEIMITALQGDVETLQDDIDDITCNCDIDEDDLEDLEDDVKKYCRNRCEDGEDGIDGKDGIGLQQVIDCAINATTNTEFRGCVGNITITQ